MQESHVSVMKSGLNNGLNFIFSKYYLPDGISEKGVDAILDYYEINSEQFDIETSIPIGAVNEIAGQLYYQNNKEGAFELLNHGIEIHPHSAVLHASIAELYLEESNKELAEVHYNIALRLSSRIYSEYLKYESLLKGIN